MTISTLNLYESLLQHDRPVAWWGLDADPSYDDSGNGYTLTAVGAPVRGSSLLKHGDGQTNYHRNGSAETGGGVGLSDWVGSVWPTGPTVTVSQQTDSPGGVYGTKCAQASFVNDTTARACYLGNFMTADDVMLCRPGESVRVMGWGKMQAQAAQAQLDLQIRWYGAGWSYVAETTVASTANPTTGTWYSMTGAATAPANTVYAMASLIVSIPGTAGTYTVRADGMLVCYDNAWLGYWADYHTGYGSRDFDGTDDAYYTPGTLYVAPTAPPPFHAATANAGTTTTTTLFTPGNVQAGDLEIACLVHATNTAAMSSVPTGWTLMSSGSNADCAYAFYKRLPVVDEIPTAHTWTWSTSGQTLGVLGVYRGCDPAVSGLVYASAIGTSTGTSHASSVVAHPAMSHAVVFWVADSAATITAATTGMKSRADVAAGTVKAVMAEYDLAQAGSMYKAATTDTSAAVGSFILTFGSPDQVLEDKLASINKEISIHAIINPDTIAAGSRTIVARQNEAWLLRLEGGTLVYYYWDGTAWQGRHGPWVSASTTTHVVVTDDGEYIRFYKNGLRTNLVSDGSFESAMDPDVAGGDWTTSSGAVTVNYDGADVVHPTTGGYRCYSESRTDSVAIVGNEYIPVDPTKPYVLAHYVRQWQQLGVVDPNGTIRLHCFDAAKTELGYVYPNEAAPGVNYDSGHAITYTGSFARWGGRYRGEAGVTGTATGGFIPGTRYVRVAVYLQYTPTTFSAGIGVVIDAVELVQGESPMTWSNSENYLSCRMRPNALPISPSGGDRVYVGSRYYSGAPQEFWDGRIDEVAVFDTPLSDDMVAAYWQAYSDGTFGQFLQPVDQTRPVYPRAKLEVAWSSPPTNNTLAWTNVTPDLRSSYPISTRRGRNFELDKIEAGTLDFTVDNRNRKYDPAYVSSPLYPYVIPTRAVRLRAQAGVDLPVRPIFFGYTEGHPLLYPELGLDAVASFSAVDSFKALALDQIQGSYVRNQELSGVRLAALLDGFPGIPFVGEAGQSEVAGDDLDGVNSLDHAQQVAETEGGVLFADASGRVTFQSRHYRSRNSRSPTATYGVDGWGMRDIRPLVDEARLFTAASVTPASGRVQSVYDVDQVGQHFLRTKVVTTLHASDNDAQAMAEIFAYRYATPRVRVPSILMQPAGNPTNPSGNWDAVLAHEISDRVRTRERPLGSTAIVERDHFVEGISHDISADDWQVSLSVSPAELEGEYWLVGQGLVGQASGLTSTRLGW